MFVRSLLIVLIFTLHANEILAKQCYQCLICNDIDNSNMTRIEVNDSDWCYKGIVNGLIIRGSLGRKCVEVAQETFCCQEHLCNEANSLTLGSITVVVSSIINFIHRKK